MDPDTINQNEDIHPDTIPEQTWNELIQGTGIMVGSPGSAPPGGGGLSDGQGGLTPIAQDLKSSNFSAGASGWRIRSNGDVEFNSGTFRGNLTAASIDIPNTTTANSFHVDSSGNAWWGATAIGSAVAKVLNTGAATFTSGAIGGWTIGATTLYSTNIVIDNANEKITVGSGANQITIAGSAGTITASNSAWVLNGSGSMLIGTSLTAGEDLSANDFVYPSATDIVDRVRPTSFESNTATFTEADNVSPDFAYKILKIDATRTLHVTGGFKSTGKELQAIIGTINAGETDMTYGSAYTFSSASSYYYDVCQFDTTKFLVIYERSNATSDLLAVVLDVDSSGSTITAGTIKIIDADAIDTAQVSCAKLDTGRVAITYYDGTDYRIQVLSISGSTITLNTDAQLHTSGSQTRAALVLLTTDKLLCVFAGDATDPLVAKTIDVVSTTPTINGSNTLDSTAREYTIGLALLSATKVALVYSYNDGAGDVGNRAAILTVSGSTVTKGSNLQLSSANPQEAFYINILAISPSVLLTATQTNDTTVKYHLLYVDGTTVTSTATESVSTTSATHKSTWVCKVKPFKYLGVTGVIYTYITLGSNSDLFIGVANAAIADAATGVVRNRFQTHITFTGLTAGSVYYIDDSGTITTESSSLSVQCGTAINTTTMLLI